MDKAFINIIDPNDAEEKVLQRAYRRVGGKRGSIANIHQVQSLHPEAMMDHLDLYMTLMYKESPLTRIQREIIGTVVSVYNECEYCIVHHYEALEQNWSEAPSAEKLAMKEGIEDDQTEIMIEFARILTLKPDQVNLDDYQGLIEVGFSDRAVLDISLIVGYFNFVNRLVMGTGVKLEDQSERDYKY